MSGELGPEERAIREEIEAAFGHVPAARADEMLLDAYADDDDAYGMAAAFGGRHWTSLTVSELFYHREMVGALNAVGTRAYLPAYLAACLVDDRRHRSDIVEHTLFALRPGSQREADVARVRDRLSLLDGAQRAAVDSVLRYLQERWGLGPGELRSY